MKPFLALCLTALFVLPVFSQNVASIIHDETARWNLATAQIETSLDSKYQSVREQTLKNAIVIVTLYRDKIDLSEEGSILRKVYEEAESVHHRKLALALLYTIGGDRVQQYLDLNSTEAESEQVRITLASVLNDYFTHYHGSADIG